jgi:formate hydrogenlyase subunit 3/multisubunit Na+/H+ antiporter MnhD subunit
VFFILLSCVLVIFYSTAELFLKDNNLMGTIPSQIALMSNLSELSIVWLLVVMLIAMCCSLYSHACLSFSILQLGCLSGAIV